MQDQGSPKIYNPYESKDDLQSAGIPAGGYQPYSPNAQRVGNSQRISISPSSTTSAVDSDDAIIFAKKAPEQAPHEAFARIPNPDSYGAATALPPPFAQNPHLGNNGAAPTLNPPSGRKIPDLPPQGLQLPYYDDYGAAPSANGKWNTFESTPEPTPGFTDSIGRPQPQSVVSTKKFLDNQGAWESYDVDSGDAPPSLQAYINEQDATKRSARRGANAPTSTEPKHVSFVDMPETIPNRARVPAN